MSRTPFFTLLLGTLFFSTSVLADGHEAAADMADHAKQHVMDKSDEAKDKANKEMKHDEKAVDTMFDKGEHDATDLKDKIEKDL